MKIVAIIGPYRAKTIFGTANNIQAARKIHAILTGYEIACFCPHMNTAMFDGLQPDQFFLDLALEMMRRCDAVFVMEGSELSEGAMNEVAEAIARGIPAFTVVHDLIAWYHDVDVAAV